MTATRPDSDALLADLEESIPQGVASSTNYGRRASDTVDSDLLSLDALLQESMQDKLAKEQYKKDRAAAARGYVGLSKEEVEFCNSRLRAFEMAREWDVDRAIAVFAHYHCQQCDTARIVFSRLMEHHKHRHNPTAHRWVTVEKTNIKELQPVLEDRPVPMCTTCMEQFDIPAISDEEPVWLEDLFDGNV